MTERGAEQEWDPELWCMPGIGHSWAHELVTFDDNARAHRVAKCRNCGYTVGLQSAADDLDRLR